MHSLAIHLLSARDESGKLIVGAIVFVIWLIGSIISSIKKGADARKVQQEKQRMAATRAAMRVPTVPQAQSRRQQPTMPQQPRVPVSRKVAKRRPPPIPKKAPPAPPRQREPEPIMMQVVDSVRDDRARTAAATARPATSSARPTTATAAALNRWLNPTTMRQQFILTELLQPPITMREDREF
jgi:hypothetical protein